jgi:hypothetical protein
MLAVLDAVTWPALWFYGAMQLPNKGGMIGGFVAACAVLAGLSRLHTAVWHNHRYGFTTWRWGKVLAWMVVFTYVLKWVMVR